MGEEKRNLTGMTGSSAPPLVQDENGNWVVESSQPTTPDGAPLAFDPERQTWWDPETGKNYGFGEPGWDANNPAFQLTQEQFSTRQPPELTRDKGPWGWAEDPDWLVNMRSQAERLMSGEFSGNVEDIYKPQAAGIEASAAARRGALASSMASQGITRSGRLQSGINQIGVDKSLQLGEARGGAEETYAQRKAAARKMGRDWIGKADDWKQRLRGVGYSGQESDEAKKEAESMSQELNEYWDNPAAFLAPR